MDRPATIFALSSAPGRAGVAVVRVSGPAAGMVLNVMAAPRPKPRVAAGRLLKHPKTGQALDYGLVLWFPAPRSFTGEDAAELQIHGGTAVVRAVLGALATIPGCRAAEAGEFARRAFDAGKLDLTAVEGLADLIEAETEQQRRQALRQAGGGLNSLYQGWREQLIEATALVTSAIDFSDEADVGDRAFEQARGVVEGVSVALARHLADGRRGEILRSGFRVALAGPPNVGKSSLLNALARRDVAIVSEEAGTTRDVLEARLDLSGVPVIVFDTAGMRESGSAVEKEGIRRTIATAESADLVIWVVDAHAPQMHLPSELEAVADRTLVVLNKMDLVQGGMSVTLPDDLVAVSARTGQGLETLVERLSAIAEERIGDRDEPTITQARHRVLLEDCAASLRQFQEGSPFDVELRAEDLRRASVALGKITGHVHIEEVLGEIFKRFCIGK